MTRLQILKNNTAILIIGNEIQAAHHVHHALQVSIALENPFTLEWQSRSGNKKKGEFTAAIIAPDVKHSLDGKGGKLALFLIDPEHVCAKKLVQKWLEQDAVSTLPSFVHEPVVALLSKLHSFSSSSNSGRNLIDALLNLILPEGINLEPMDQRIQSALNYLQTRPVKNVSASELANEVHLSESRLGHLFKQQVGIPVRRYLMWLRLMDALECAFAGSSLTNAAAHAGFSDSAHFSRTFLAMFGVQPSVIVQYSQFIQVS